MIPTILYNAKVNFPNPELALEEPNGLLAIGGDLSAPRLLEAYNKGIFPWFTEDSPILWWSPNPRAVLFLDQLKISRSLKKILQKNLFEISFNRAFEQVIKACAEPRKHEDSTWITEEMIEAYIELHRAGIAHSVEVWQHQKLVGGLYGVTIGGVFCGESMFSRVSNASKIALVYLVEHLQQRNFSLIDCQIMNPHLASLGAINIPRKQFLTLLNQAKSIKANF